MSTKKLAQILICAFVAPLLLVQTSESASGVLSQRKITICTNLKTGYKFISKTEKCNERFYETRTWYEKGAAPSGTPGFQLIEMTTCTSKGPAKQYIRVLTTCNPKIQTTTLWQRPLGPPEPPSIKSIDMDSFGTATLNIIPPTEDGGARVTSYEVRSNTDTIKSTFTPTQINAAKLSGLIPGTTYRFTVIAINAAGKSLESVTSKSITYTPPPPPVQVAPVQTLAGPAFTLSTSSETRRVNTIATGFTINSNGGAIASFSISPAAPDGMSFNTTTGAFSGTPRSVGSATTYTVTATNTTGSATQSFIFTVTAEVISVAAVSGVTVPIVGATPVTTVTAANGYTGTITWSGSPSTFAVSTIYTATINLSAASGYTLTGVTANFFTVAGATSVTHDANSGIITAEFPMTTWTLGAVGPGGGKIFYYSAAGFNCGPTFSASGSPTGGKCHYLEAAPKTWSGGSSDPRIAWASEVNWLDWVKGDQNYLYTSIGSGYLNSLDIQGQTGNVASSSAAVAARAYAPTVSGVTYSDWYLPSYGELFQLYLQKVLIGAEGVYWSSSDEWDSQAIELNFDDGTNNPPGKDEQLLVRPIRAF